MTQIEAAELFRAHFDDLVERKLKAVLSANDKLTEAQQLRDLADRAVLQAKAADQASTVAGGAGFLAHAAEVAQAGHEIAYVVNSGAADSDGLTVTASVDTVDPVTGEVARSVTSYVDRPCPECAGEGRLQDKTGGGHHRCRECAGKGTLTETVTVPVVLVAWPNNPDMQTVEVGPLTRFGELAAGYLASLPADDLHHDDAFSDYAIIDVDADSERDGSAVITGNDHGLCFSVERRAS
jgi:hypothetical protein